MSKLDAGHQWELEVLGHCSMQYENTGYKSWGISVQEAISAQNEYPWDIRNPKTAKASILFRRIKELLSDEDASKLKFFCTIGTAMDFWHGTDAMLMIDNYIISIDLKIKGIYKQTDSVIVTPRDLFLGSFLSRLAKDIATTFSSRRASY